MKINTASLVNFLVVLGVSLVLSGCSATKPKRPDDVVGKWIYDLCDVWAEDRRMRYGVEKAVAFASCRSVTSVVADGLYRAALATLSGGLLSADPQGKNSGQDVASLDRYRLNSTGPQGRNSRQDVASLDKHHLNSTGPQGGNSRQDVAPLNGAVKTGLTEEQKINILNREKGLLLARVESEFAKQYPSKESSAN